MLQAGKFRILAVAAPRRLPALPAIPTMTELGYPDSNYTSHFGFFGPAKTPEPVLKRLHDEINAVLARGYSTQQGIQALEEVFAQTMPREMGYDFSGMSYQERAATQGVPPAE